MIPFIKCSVKGRKCVLFLCFKPNAEAGFRRVFYPAEHGKVLGKAWVLSSVRDSGAGEIRQKSSYCAKKRTIRHFPEKKTHFFIKGSFFHRKSEAADRIIFLWKSPVRQGRKSSVGRAA